MQFGLFYEQQIPRPWHTDAEQRRLDEALEQVELADRLGIEYAWAVEHHFLEEYSHSSAPEVFLAACSQRTKHIRLCHGIVHMPSTVNHPARVAERIATLDLVSHGRVEWGTGEAGTRQELDGFNISYLKKRNMWREATREAARMMCMEPYPGYRGQYFSMPHRNVVPKPVQKPHPPLWVACSNHDTIRLAARLGIGALTFAFADPGEAKYWVDEYYMIFKNECEPIGRAVNPNIAMVTGFMCHEDSQVAVQRGLEGFHFFRHALAHYYRTGAHVPGRFNVWEDFKQNSLSKKVPTAGIGSPDEVRAHLEQFEGVGVDQIIFIQQAGNNRHEHICESLELFASQVMPAFQGRHAVRQQRKAEELAPFVDAAMRRMPPLAAVDSVPAVEAYPMMLRGTRRVLAQLQRGPSPEVDASPVRLWQVAAPGGSPPAARPAYG